MSRVGIAIDQATNDIYMSDTGDIAIVRDAEAVGQHVRQRLQTYSEEWFLDQSIGVPWLDEVLGLSYNPVLAESIVKAEIMDTDLVTGITSFSVGFNRQTRGLIIKDVSINTTYDEEVSI
mgnify:CR=1 FL=1